MKKPVLMLIVGLLVGGLVSYLVVEARVKAAVGEIHATISMQEAELTSLLDLTYNNRTDEVVAKIVKGCTNDEQTRFDALLDALTGLSLAELNEAEELLTKCGDYTALKKVVMVTRLERELQIYQDQIALLKTIAPTTAPEDYHLETWQQLVALEKQRSESLQTFVLLQGEVIQGLKDGFTTESETIQDVTAKVIAERESYTVLRAEIDRLRESL